MNKIGACEAKNTFGGLLDRVARGEEIVITRRGKPVAKLIRADAAGDRATAHRAAAALRALAREIKGPPLSRAEINAYRDEGRR